jgi:RNA polymerase sigma-70 factor (ECF subfamily)
MAEIELNEALRDELRASWHRYLDLVQPLRPVLHGYCRRLAGNLWDAEDLVQETLVRTFGALGKIHHEVGNPRAYLLRAATNLWVDMLRRRRTAEDAPLESPRPEPGPETAAEVREAGAVLLQHLAPREAAAVILKDAFDMSLEETAEVLETTVGAVKSALHRGRKRLRESGGELLSDRPTPSEALVDRFVSLFNAVDKPGLLELVLDNASVENVGCGLEFGYDGHRAKTSWFEGALGGHPGWPAAWRYEAQRAERVTFAGEPLTILFRTRQGEEAAEVVVRLEEEGGRIARLRAYGFCPEVMREVTDALGLPVRTGVYRYPTPEPGRHYPS